jgi:translation initiation factor 2B subunit (eIF-2B alpha/beta/delta family)
MKPEEIIEMAMVEAEFVLHGKPSDEESELFVCIDKDIVRFYQLAIDAEMERCLSRVDIALLGADRELRNRVFRAINKRGEEA